MNPSATAPDELFVTPAHKDVVRRGGFIDAGPFQLWIERDFVRAEERVSPDLDSLRCFLYLLEEVRRQHGKIYLLLVVSEQVSPPPAPVRRFMAEWSAQHGSNGVAIITSKTSLFAVMTNLLLRAMSLVRSTQRPFAFFSTEEEGRRWLEDLRQRTPG